MHALPKVITDTAAMLNRTYYNAHNFRIVCLFHLGLQGLPMSLGLGYVPMSLPMSLGLGYVPRRLFCFGSLVILDVARCYVLLFPLYINIKIG